VFVGSAAFSRFVYCVGASSCEAIDVDICSWLELHGVYLN
jgi:hypothetical protein